MFPVTEAVAALFDANQPQLVRITGTDENGTNINITEADVVAGGFSIDRFSTTGARLEVGTAISSELTLKLNNYEGTFNRVKFEGAELFVEIGIADWSQSNPEITWIPCGYFTPDAQPRNQTIINIKALDRMMRFDAVPPTLTPWTTETGATMHDEAGNVLYFCADLVFPATVSQLIDQVCVRCGVELAHSIDAMPNATMVIDAAPQLQQTTTFRNFIQWCAGLMGTNAFIDWDGKLQFSWYTNTGYTSTPDRRYSSDLQESDIMITGVCYTDAEQVTHVAGSDAYALDMSSNYLLTGLDDTALASALQGVYLTVNGFKYRPFEAKVMPAPWLWPMDRVTFVDLQGNTHLSLLTNVNTTINGATNLKGSGETAQASSYAPTSGLTPAQVQALRRVLQSSNEQLEAAIADATRQITGATNSNVRFMYNESGALTEILVMDSPDVETAVNVWRWNSGGLGHSSNGYGGPYSLAMTQDGSIVATMITSGILNATLMRTGIIEDINGLNYWNLSTGDFKLAATTTIGSGTTTIGDVAEAASAAITGVDVEYAQNQSDSVAPVSGWSTVAPAWASGYYIWQRTATTTPNGTTYSTPTCISGRDGVDGTSVTILGSYNTLAELQAAHPTGNDGDAYMVSGDLYVWNGSAWENVGQIQGPQGPMGPVGPQGQDGADGVGVTNVKEQYYLSTSDVSPMGGSWSYTQPQWASGKYIWTRSEITWTNYRQTTTTPVLAQAINEANSTASSAAGAVTTLDNALNQQGIFNRLTNNGQTQGIYLQNGKLYLNGTYLQAGYISGDRISAGIISSVSGTNTKFDLDNGELVTVGDVGAGSSFDNTTVIGGGAISIYSGTEDMAGYSLAGIISAADGTDYLLVQVPNGLVVDGHIQLNGGIDITAASIYVRTDDTQLPMEAYTGSFYDYYGNEVVVINGLIVSSGGGVVI